MPLERTEFEFDCISGTILVSSIVQHNILLNILKDIFFYSNFQLLKISLFANSQIGKAWPKAWKCLIQSTKDNGMSIWLEWNCWSVKSWSCPLNSISTPKNDLNNSTIQNSGRIGKYLKSKKTSRMNFVKMRNWSTQLGTSNIGTIKISISLQRKWIGKHFNRLINTYYSSKLS